MNETVAREQLRSLVERIERVEEERKSIADDIKDVHAEAKGSEFDVKALRRIIAIRKQDQNERLEAEALLDTHLAAFGMLEQFQRKWEPVSRPTLRQSKQFASLSCSLNGESALVLQDE